MTLSFPAAIGAAALALTGWTSLSGGPDGRVHRVADAVVDTPSDMPFRLSPRQHSTAINPLTSAAIVDALAESRLFCAGLIAEKRAFAVDCVAERLKDVDRRMSGTRGYEEVRSALVDAARAISWSVLRNDADEVETTRFRDRGQDGRMIGTQRRLIPLDEAQREAVALTAISVIEQAEARVAQAPAGSPEAAAQLRAIAAAIGETKMILRAAGR